MSALNETLSKNGIERLLHVKPKYLGEIEDFIIIMQEIQLCVVCFSCGTFNLFYFINLLVAGYFFIIPHSIFFNIKYSV